LTGSFSENLQDGSWRRSKEGSSFMDKPQPFFFDPRVAEKQNPNNDK